MRYAVFSFWVLLALLLSAQSNACAMETEILPDVIYGHKDGMALTYDILLPPEEERNGAGVLFMVSGGWVSRWFDPKLVISPANPLSAPFRGLLDRGYVLYIVRHGSAPKYKVPEAVSDVKQAVAHVRAEAPTLGVDSERLGAIGLSAGGHLSLVLGTMGRTDEEGNTRTSPPVAAVVAWYPPTSLVPYMDRSDDYDAFDFNPDFAESISPRLHVDSSDAPALLFHGTLDRIVPLEHSEAMRDAMETAGVEVRLEVFEGQGHGFTPGAMVRSMNLMFEFFGDQIGSKADVARSDDHTAPAIPDD